MQEKKLTDEEIVKALENTKITLDDLKEDDDDYEKLLLVKKITNCSLDLIRRLQYGYSSASKASDEWREKYEKEQKENAEQKKEIKRLTNWYDTQSGLYNNLQEENSELQKQVDELKKRLVNDFEAFKVEVYGKVKQQAVKDTAKEILQRIMNIIKKSDGFLCEEVIRIMAKQNGVEVE